jgi:hypothetical protein
LSVALLFTIVKLLRGSPRADGQATVVGALAVASALAYGLGVAPWLGFVVAVVGALFLTEQFYAPLWLLPALAATLTRPEGAGGQGAPRR